MIAARRSVNTAHNAIEAVSSKLRRAVRARDLFPGVEAALPPSKTAHAILNN